MFDFLIWILNWKKTQLVMENLRLRWIEGKLLGEEVKALEEENKRLKEGIKEALLRLRGGVAVLPSPVEVEKSEPERKEKREEKKEGKRTRWTEEERERIRDWIKARVSPLMVYEKYDGRPVRREGTCYKALCPFHPDKNPSLAIYEDGFFKCYAGCEFEVGKKRKERGDIFAFVQKWVLEKEGKRINFDEAMERIIKDFSLALPLKSPVEALERNGKREGIGKSIVSFSEASLGGGGGEKTGVLEGREGEGRKKEGGWRGLTMRQYKEYCGIISEEIEGMPWRDYFNGYGQILEGVWFFKEKKFKSIAEPFSKYEEAIRKREAVPCVKFEVWDLNENGEIDYFPERINLRHSVPEGFYHGEGMPSPIYGLHLFLSDMDRPVLICEGASDGFLSILLGFIPFALPGNTNWRRAVEYLPIIFERYGKREVYILVEPEENTEKMMQNLYDELRNQGIKAIPFSFNPYKDLRDWWCAFVEEKGREPRLEDFFEFQRR